jgi:ATP synthase protein I
MTGDTRGDGDPDKSYDEAALSERRGRLNRRLSDIRVSRQASQNEGAPGGASARASAMAVGLRLSSELVAGVVVGAVLGWGFDKLLSTSPWGLIVFLMLGFAAGVFNVVRSSGAGKAN